MIQQEVLGTKPGLYLEMLRQILPLNVHQMVIVQAGAAKMAFAQISLQIAIPQALNLQALTPLSTNQLNAKQMVIVQVGAVKMDFAQIRHQIALSHLPNQLYANKIVIVQVNAA